VRFQNAIGEIFLQKYNFIFNVVFDEVIFYEVIGLLMKGLNGILENVTADL
jgi:hypothetical protein